jgi:hypothetical protein
MSAALTSEQLGLCRDANPGAPRLVRALLRDGLPVEALPAALALAAELEQVCIEQRDATEGKAA